MAHFEIGGGLFPEVAAWTVRDDKPAKTLGTFRDCPTARYYFDVWAGKLRGTPKTLHPGKGERVMPVLPEKFTRDSDGNTVDNPHYYTAAWMSEAEKAFKAWAKHCPRTPHARPKQAPRHVLATAQALPQTTHRVWNTYAE